MDCIDGLKRRVGMKEMIKNAKDDMMNERRLEMMKQRRGSDDKGDE